ncbi:PstS family phosphate ABC transporter substrate-binding protein [Rhodoplanes sp. TEM]|uniref:PstS family phosphate ABC transporter substrate-binding protein n=1 Tax=Rhodoplanes tepidamans TaxID=200616 RepID=A0ABT5J987_RHOTP|nr:MULTISPECIES: PstS family phosphate ABC transporter substrate-binding protein [Rhodoplanes]MDC7786210.1 PstS family phosphate ABC transporter substrate-binding protein [Rhodoplanes tepidamans]MDC7982419.1 PstS family phosphate ABC transporter substrate-binding protein [Rhodoplanes sp. TEM]MDQ0355009.1 phosphate transport system substrate-binding protein [Rhodoplanes tepidamans]
MKLYRSFIAAGAIAATGLALTGAAEARDQIRIVGSSTVYPFTTAVAEQLGKTGGVKTPVVESTGTGGGMKLFCAGVGVDHPDATNASRRMKKSEFEQCQKNGVKDIVELTVGFDGISVAQSKAGTPLKLTLGQLFLALAKEVPGPDGKLVANPNKTWSDIDKSLPNIKIEVLGPPPTSGTRDALHELLLEPGALSLPAMQAIKKADAKAFDKAWKSLREDGAYVEAGENDNVIVQKLEANKNAFGIFGYSFLEENAAKLRGAPLNGVEPTYDNIAGGKYPGSRLLYVYLKKQHVGVIPGLDKFAAEYVSNKAIGEDGYLAKKGLVTLPKAKADAVRKDIESMKPLTADPLS